MYTPKFLMNTPVFITFTDGIDENGAAKLLKEVTTSARVETSNSVVYDAEGKKARLKAKAFIFEKLEQFPDEMKGTCYVGNLKYDIHLGSKKRNPDGSVNHIVLELM